MRIRRKKHLNERLEACSDVFLGYLLFDQNIPGSPDVPPIDTIETYKNDKPIWLEIGCGCGRFAVETAKLNPDISFIGLEQVSNVAVSAMESAIKEKVENLKFIIGKADFLLRVFPKESVSRIYLNFSCPYPKKTYANRRLTHPRFLKQYQTILKSYGEIFLKTDSESLFLFSKTTLKDHGFTLRFETNDLHNCPEFGNIKSVITEYEERFISKGCNIYYLEAIKASE